MNTGKVYVVVCKAMYKFPFILSVNDMFHPLFSSCSIQQYGATPGFVCCSSLFSAKPSLGSV